MVKDVGSGEILVSSIRSGMKREFAMMMKAQSEMGDLSAGRRRVTRSQNVGSSGQVNGGSGVKRGKRVNGASSKRTKKGGGEKSEVEGVEKMVLDDVLDGEGMQNGLVEEGTNVEVGIESRDFQAEVVAAEQNGLVEEGTNVDVGIESRDLLAEAVAAEQNGLVEEGTNVEVGIGSRDLLAEAVAAEQNGLVEEGTNVEVGIESRDLQAEPVAAEQNGLVEEGTNVEVGIESRDLQAEPVVAEQSGLVEEGTIVDGEIESRDLQAEPVAAEQNGLVDEGINVEVEIEFKDLQAEPVVEEKIDAARVRDDLKESVMLPLCTELALPQVGVMTDVEIVQVDDIMIGGASDLARERVEEVTSGLPEKPLRRFTRSALKRQDQVAKLESSARVAKSPCKLELKMSKKVEPKKDLTKLEDLLLTGLLEGLSIRYICGTESRESPVTELHGVIQGNVILCSCGECKGEKVVTPDQFELHAHSGNKRPAEYIYLENGKSLQDVLNECKVDHPDSLEKVIRNAVGRSDSKTAAFCLSCKGPIPEAGAGRAMLLCDSCFVPKESDPGSTQISDAPSRSPLVDLPAPVASTSQSDVSESFAVSSNSLPRMKPQGRLTKKDLGMHKIVFTEDVLPDGAPLHYVVQGQKKLDGYKKNGAILCTHCGNVVSPSQFEAHAGFASRRKPYDNIFTSNGISLHKLSLELSRNRISSSKENDDLCSICEDGGDLLCCEHCPRAFHPECVGLSSIPQDTWYCRYCQNMFEKAKYEEHSANAIAAGRIAGVDPLAEITQRCIRIIRTSKSDIGGCAICRSHDFTKKVFNDRTVIICDQCEKEYHVGCLREKKMDDLKALPKDDWFCCKQCSNVNSALQKVIVDGQQRLSETLTDIVKKKGEKHSLEQNSELDITWRLLRGNGASSEASRKWLSGAVSIFHDRFDPIADSSTSHLDLIPHMVYGRRFRGQDFRGMYCAVLMVNSVEVCAGMFRIFGEEVAELPLVATRSTFEGKGYFQSLFFCIENLLSSLNVKDLVLPAANEAESLWTNRFGFEKLGAEQIDHYKKNYSQMMIFQETSVLHKLITQADGGKASDEPKLITQSDGAKASDEQKLITQSDGGEASDEHKLITQSDGGEASDEHKLITQPDGGKASDEPASSAQEEPLSID